MRQWSNKHIGFTNIEMEILLLFLLGIESRVHKYRDGNSASVLGRYRAKLNALVKVVAQNRQHVADVDHQGISYERNVDPTASSAAFIVNIEPAIVTLEEDCDG